MDLNNLALRPNCLMTKYPLVFITGTRSLFFFEKLGGNLQDYIAAHGYVVLNPILPFRSRSLRKLSLKNWLSSQNNKRFHFVLSRNTHQEFDSILNEYKDSSFTISDDLKMPSVPTEPLQYKLHRLFCRLQGHTPAVYCSTLPDKSTEFYERFLDHCIELAENEDI